MGKIVTLTPNPAVDLSTSIDRVVPTLKLRCTAPRRDPGGGGINVARVVKRFGGDVEAILPAGGFTGQLLRRLIDDEGITTRIIEVEAETREDFYVAELSKDFSIPFHFAWAAAARIGMASVSIGTGGYRTRAEIRGGQRKLAARRTG